MLAPEGTRSPNATLQKAWPGASYLAAKAGAPIIPVALVGCEDAKFFPNLKRLRRTQVTVYAGEPFTLPPVPVQNREAVLEQYTDEIMCRIAALLPPAYRGYYADHPRLKELLSSRLARLSRSQTVQSRTLLRGSFSHLLAQHTYILRHQPGHQSKTYPAHDPGGNANKQESTF